MLGLGGIKEKLEQAKLKAEATKLRLDSVHVEGASGEYVRVISTANSRIVQILLNDKAKTFSAGELSRHTLVATNVALEKARSINEAEMAAVARETMPNIPGMPNLESMFK
ncbi:MAG: DNA-binding protein YbaB [Salibacteraceae bacterium]|jgi:DNA-binding protein YbaB|tara:strand:+ start:227 stop:559 length:333 start_codon:yes stop_codon:yes gene_type:complete